MSARPLRFSPGTPAFFYHVRDGTVELSRLVEALLPTQQPVVWLDSARHHPLTGRYSVVGWDPWLTLRAEAGRVTVSTSQTSVTRCEHPLVALRRVMAAYRVGGTEEDTPPIRPGLVGAFGYELSRWIERLPEPKASPLHMPELLLWGMRLMIVADHETDRHWVISVIDPESRSDQAASDAQARLEEVCHLLDCIESIRRRSGLDPEPSRRVEFGDCRAAVPPPRIEATIEPMVSQQQFETMVHQAKASIAAGEIFQANLAHAFSASWSGSPWALYRALRGVNPSPFACFIQCAEFAIVSCSPERLVRVCGEDIETRPIAGTRPRGHTAQEDLLNSIELLLSDKERAEHIMLVDLERNDVGRVCRYGSVHVEELMTIEEYSHVMHIVSNVRGRLRHGVDLVDVIRAMFPGGTITGCPKVRCMEIIHELEPTARGFYTGSCGYLGFDGSMDLNLLIRTMVLQSAQVSFHVGAGIVADSIPEREYHETLSKAAALVSALQMTGAGISNDVTIR